MPAVLSLRSPESQSKEEISQRLRIIRDDYQDTSVIYTIVEEADNPHTLYRISALCIY